MARKFTPKVLTANDLMEGDVVYLDKDDGWTRHHEEAKYFEDEHEADNALAQAKKLLELVGPYLADAALEDNGKPVPTHFREMFRTKGPSNYTDHGKQAE